jgi:hypothetical protein
LQGVITRMGAVVPVVYLAASLQQWMRRATRRVGSSTSTECAGLPLVALGCAWRHVRRGCGLQTEFSGNSLLFMWGIYAAASDEEGSFGAA